MKNANPENRFSSQMTAARSRFGVLLLSAMLCIAMAALAAHSLAGRGSFAGQVTVTPLSGGQADLEVNAVGNVTHLGKSTVRIHLRADVSGPIPTPIPPSTGVVTTANGDTVTFTLRWTLREISPGVFAPSGPFDITGGTGRFSGATGSGDYHGFVNLSSGEATADITGELAR